MFSSVSLTLDADSALFAAICGGGSECTIAASVLNETLPCTGEECGSVSCVELGGESGIRWHGVLSNVGHDSGGRKRTHLGMCFFVLHVRVVNGLHLCKLE